MFFFDANTSRIWSEHSTLHALYDRCWVDLHTLGQGSITLVRIPGKNVTLKSMYLINSWFQVNLLPSQCHGAFETDKEIVSLNSTYLINSWFQVNLLPSRCQGAFETDKEIMVVSSLWRLHIPAVSADGRHHVSRWKLFLNFFVVARMCVVVDAVSHEFSLTTWRG